MSLSSEVLLKVVVAHSYLCPLAILWGVMLTESTVGATYHVLTDKALWAALFTCPGPADLKVNE